MLMLKDHIHVISLQRFIKELIIFMSSIYIIQHLTNNEGKKKKNREFALLACFLGQTWRLQHLILKHGFLKYLNNPKSTQIQVKCVLQEESLRQVDFDNLYFWNTLNKTHQGIFVWNKNNRLHTNIRNMCIKGEKKQHIKG